MKHASSPLTLILALLFGGLTAAAQNPPATVKTPADSSSAKPADSAVAKPAPDTSRASRCDAEMAGPEKTFYLNNSVQASDANEIVTALRNMLNVCDRVFLVASQSAIVMQASPEQMTLAQKLISDLDRPRKTYRLTYTVTEIDGSKSIGVQHFAMVVTSGQATTLKQGSKVPIATGSYNAVPTTPGGVQTQFTYLDVGMNFAVTLDDFANGVRLNTNVEQSSVAGDTTIAGVNEPIIRQTSLKGTAFLTPGKPLMLGSIDIPGSTRHLNVEVVMEQMP